MLVLGVGQFRHFCEFINSDNPQNSAFFLLGRFLFYTAEIPAGRQQCPGGGRFV